jgi:CubicO group peptidase (beta-lactamase class C family)
LQPWLDNAWAVVEEIGKLTLSDYFKKNLFEPLGINAGFAYAMDLDRLCLPYDSQSEL